MTDIQSDPALNVPARDITTPAFLSAEARSFLKPQPGASLHPSHNDKAGWRAYVSAANTAAMSHPLIQDVSTKVAARVAVRDVGSARVFDAAPVTLTQDSRGIVLDMHGGGLILGGGELCRIVGTIFAARFQQRVWSVDYRMPPDHPYPAALDDCVAAYRALLKERNAADIVVSGTSAGGNLAAALILRARDEGLPLPAGLILRTPEVDLTESGDSFQTNKGIDNSLGSLMPVNLLYAAGQDLRHPYLSPLFGDFSNGFPPTLLTTGTRDLYLSNTVRMHRALRAAGVSAELHVVEAAPHVGFPGSPEGEEIDREIRRFIRTAHLQGDDERPCK